ncbi:hypothetical protein MYCTH_2309587 [Thermothelomyces thermophilus ATCC 42464]|uniref:DUF1857-domain-containing protein n=1 Tax=Thermothelomyces thermophilus (strain ATCC 42464 / BCRC 31852 / DSM 1799) TaxID=573729 RepID=G2QIX8_THET4|nr:uncharacterized protein MYCTH_2309587 [Thermothelomyces thermophilus ATCC 42464]AEO60397.1 hypothetical protein MYCTH_2309587 [Thermothelomyces thermophilus ATCC 42464]
MVTINLAYTAPINPPGADPELTPDQVWTGLQYKVRRADKFVPIITACEVLDKEPPAPEQEEEEEEGPRVITRRVTFRPGITAVLGGGGDDGSSPRVVREVCRLYAPCRVDFVQDDGSTVGNYVSRGPAGELMMTYVFEWRAHGERAGSARVRELEERYAKVAKMAIDGSIETIRKMVKGEIAMD